MPSLEQGGWTFDVRQHRDDMKRGRLRTIPGTLEEPIECIIRHNETGIKFTFDYLHLLMMTQTPDSGIPTYDSPLQTYQGLDCAYAGRPLIKKRPLNPEWEDIEFETAVDQVAWTIQHSRVTGVPHDFEYYPALANKTKPNKPKLKDPLYPLVNCQYRVLSSFYPTDFICIFHLLVTESGWIFHLHQSIEKVDDDSKIRVRMMTMHCKFDQNVVFREITETQSPSFNERLKISAGRKGLKRQQQQSQIMERDNDTCVHFHEAKQFKIQGRRDGLPTPRTPEEIYVGGVEIPDRKVEFIFANCCKIIKAIEAVSGTHIKVIPLFQHPYSPHLGRCFGIKLMRKAYIVGEENNVEKAKSHLLELLKRTESKVRPDVADEGESVSGDEGEIVSGVGNIFLET